MNNINDPKVHYLLHMLHEKYEEDGQDLVTHLEGFLYSNYVTYWDYIHLDTLLSIQIPRTHIQDEHIFITYHQITELYFKLIIAELEQLIEEGLVDDEFIITKLKRVNCYFEQLVNSFEVMLKGLDRNQFLKFRLALLPSSGFQSFQFREIEILSTEFKNLVEEPFKNHDEAAEESVEVIYEKLYWRKGGVEPNSDKKVLGLVQFEEKYKHLIIEKAAKYHKKNIAYLWKNRPNKVLNEELIGEMRKFDANANLKWPLVHYRSAAKHLSKNSETVTSTGGTNWKKYLSPKIRRLMYFPDLWNPEEKENWGENTF
ncbi:tryptophan 2,3-dioxygenase family protein [Sphingobacterium sp. lm-10]|uniref:tryptophan 2,3-dioxygenase family protein n=1 Tax=Sphingobacterium sp. lm-10 TaxID=2944904 RepID=UPI00201FB469|nr:tryptophan 2,3-dioxygenase family protein [Sphingobacterium sp. lm-10]MCL7986434.1 tryptophan 2,3-dioxygenase family protein [Sphingobacterium sp. lm-10]